MLKSFIPPSFPYRARVTYIDYEGRSDGDSIKKIINQMKPRQLVIVHGPPEASLDLAESCKAFSKDIKVYTPKLQETVDATSETHIYQVSSEKTCFLSKLISFPLLPARVRVSSPTPVYFGIFIIFYIFLSHFLTTLISRTGRHIFF